MLAADNPPAKQAGFSSLFDGVSLQGWKQTDAIKDRWQAADGVIRLSPKQPPRIRGEDDHLWTQAEFRNFDLLVQWRLTERPERRTMNAFTADGLFRRDEEGRRAKHEVMHAGDSGIILRGDPRAQVNIWSQPMGSGDINPYHKNPSLSKDIRRACVPSTNADRPAGEWNRFEIRMRGQRVSVKLNGTLVIDNATLPGVAASGPIGLQNHGDGIEFRRLFIRRLPSGQAASDSEDGPAK